MTTACVEGAQRPDYDGWQQSISALSLGPRGWIQVGNFLLFGLMLLATVPVWRRLLRGGRAATLFPVLTALTGASLILAGLVPQDPAPGYNPTGVAFSTPTAMGLVHLGAAAVAALSAVTGLVVMSRRFAGDPAWRGWSTYSLLLAGLMTGCITVYAVGSTAATGFAGTFERLGFAVVPVWAVTFLLRLRAGAPFMVDPASSPPSGLARGGA